MTEISIVFASLTAVIIAAIAAISSAIAAALGIVAIIFDVYINKKNEEFEIESQKQRSNERQKLLHLQNLSEPWVLSSNQQSAIFAAFQAIPANKIAVHYVYDDAKRVYGFAETIHSILTKSGHDTWGYLAGIQPTGSAPPVGIHIRYKSDTARPFAENVANILIKNGLETRVYQNQSLGHVNEDDRVVIWVCQKPSTGDI